ncbi:MAG: hypothetical protein PF572_02460 [Patescibacteria group bacterium]|jgi:hypothetical protein|nr:hypothetical protein [Patescibacteria group bacterium]
MHYKKIKFLFLSLFILSIFFVFKNQSFAQESSDAISVRVLPNPTHYSSQRWYTEQGFIGTPQSLLVDGYEAIRNGNTVYVNAANIAGAVPTLFTNIYIISYNISADSDTEDIFARILDNWKFNRNINTATGFCSPDFSSVLCVTNDDCPLGEYCSSDKSETIRDTTRLANIAEFNIALDEYMKNNGHYPTLSAGTYLPNKTVSTWPSWQGTLSKELGVQLPVDPINELGDCVGYDDITCWNENDKEFADPIVDTDLDLPLNSRAFIYQANPDGSTFDICSEMESVFVFGVGSGACAAGTAAVPIVTPLAPITPITPIVGSASTVNYPPQVIASNIPTAFIGHSYTAYIQGVDPNNDTITWSIDTSMTTWTDWSGAPSLTFTAVNNQILVEATTVGAVGTYSFSITLTDPSGAFTTQTFSIQVQNFPPIINSLPLYHVASSTLPFSGGFTVSGDVLNYPLTYSLDQPLPNNFSTTFTPSGNYWDFLVSGILVPDPVSNIINHGTTPFVRNLTVTDSYGVSNSEQLIINVINHKPVIQPLSTCQDRLRSLPVAFVPPPTLLLPTIVSLSVSPNPWIVNNINTGGTVTVNVTVNTSDALTCTWCGAPVNCNGTTPVVTSGYQTGSVVSCLLVATNVVGSVNRRGFTLSECSGYHQSTGTFQGLIGSGGCSVGDPCLDINPGLCTESIVQDGPFCVDDTNSSTGHYYQECDATCSEPGAICDAFNWNEVCSGFWLPYNSYQDEVACCDDADCAIAPSCIGRECIYEAFVNLIEPLSCGLTSTSSIWYETYGKRCGELVGLNFWDTQISNGSTTADFIAAYDSDCILLSGTTNRAVCNRDLLCNGIGTYDTNTNDCYE